MRHTHVVIALIGLASCLSAGAVDANASVDIAAKGVDPFRICNALGKSLPSRLRDVRRLGAVQKETVEPDNDYCSDDFRKCEVRTIKFSGLELKLLVRKESQETSVLTIKVSDDRWRFLDKIAVGQDLADLEQYFGVKMPRHASTVVIYGECTPLQIVHKNGRVAELSLDCQACN